MTQSPIDILDKLVTVRDPETGAALYCYRPSALEPDPEGSE
jgi:hypothetical protein